MNDLHTLALCYGIFLALAVLTPFIQEAVGENSILINIPDTAIWYETIALNIVNFLLLIANFFIFINWTFGAIWWPIDLLILEPLRIFTVFILLRFIRGVG